MKLIIAYRREDCLQHWVDILQLFLVRYVAAYLLAVLGGNETPKANDLKAILESSGVGYDAEKASTVITKLAGKSVAEVLSSC